MKKSKKMVNLNLIEDTKKRLTKDLMINIIKRNPNTSSFNEQTGEYEIGGISMFRVGDQKTVAEYTLGVQNGTYGQENIQRDNVWIKDDYSGYLYNILKASQLNHGDAISQIPIVITKEDSESNIHAVNDGGHRTRALTRFVRGWIPNPEFENSRRAHMTINNKYSHLIISNFIVEFNQFLQESNVGLTLEQVYFLNRKKEDVANLINKYLSGEKILLKFHDLPPTIQTKFLGLKLILNETQVQTVPGNVLLGLNYGKVKYSFNTKSPFHSQDFNNTLSKGRSISKSDSAWTFIGVNPFVKQVFNFADDILKSSCNVEIIEGGKDEKICRLKNKKVSYGILFGIFDYINSSKLDNDNKISKTKLYLENEIALPYTDLQMECINKIKQIPVIEFANFTKMCDIAKFVKSILER